MSIRDKARNEPALAIGAVLAVLLVASEFLLGWTPGADWTEPLGKALAEAVAVLAGAFGIRQSVYAPDSHDADVEVAAMGSDPTVETP